MTTGSLPKGWDAHLGRDESGALDGTVVMYLDYAEDQAQRRRTMSMRDWEGKLDAFLQCSEREVLPHAGKLRGEAAEKLASECHEQFDVAQREAEDLVALEKLELELDYRGRGRKP